MKGWEIFAGIAIIVFFKMAGWISSWNIGLGIVAIVLAIIILQAVQNTPKLNTLSKIFLWVFGITIVLPGLYSGILKDAPLTNEAIEMGKEKADVDTSRKIRPAMLYADKGILLAANELDDEIGQTLARKAQNLVSQYSLTGSNAEIIQRELLVLTEEINQHKRYQEQLRLKVAGDQVSFTGFINDLQKSSTRMILWVVSMIGVIAILLSPWIMGEWKKLPGRIGIAIAIFLTIFFLDKVVWAQGTVGTPSMSSLPMPSFGNMPSGAVIMFGAIFFYLILLGIAFFSSNKKLWWGIFVFAVIAGLILWWASNFYTYYYHGGLQADIAAQNRMVATYKGIQQKERAKIPQAKHYDKPTPIREGLEGEFPVTLDPVHWSKEIPFGEGYGLEFEMPGWYEVLASTGDRILNKNDGTTSAGVITYMKWDGVITYPDKMIFQRQGEIRWIRVRGQAGHGKVRVYR